MLPDGLEERFRRLRRRPTERAALKADREAAVTRLVFANDAARFLPDVPLDSGRFGAAPLLVDEPGELDVLAGLDASGRPVLVRRAFGLEGEAPAAVVAHPRESNDKCVLGVRLLTWEERRVEIVSFLTSDSISCVTWIDFDEDGRVLASATAGDPHNDLGHGGEVCSCEWDGDRCTRVRRWALYGKRGTWRPSSALEAEYDATGLASVRLAADPDAPPDPDLGVVGRVIWWRGRDAPEDDPLPPDAALDVWISAVADAAEQLAAQAEDPVAVCVSADYVHDDGPRVSITERRALAAFSGRAEPRSAVIRALGPALDLVPLLDVHALRAWRSLRQQAVYPSDTNAAIALQRRLADAPWLGLVSGLHNDTWETAETVLGRDRIAAALGELALPTPAAAIDRAPSDHGELVRLLQAYRLPEALADQAAMGYALVPGGKGRSRIGGRPDLPVGVPWPVCDGRPLVHLATLDLAELPAGAAAVPRSGLVSFFADLTEEAELYEPVIVGEDERVRVITVGAGAATEVAAPPSFAPDEFYVPPVLEERRVACAEVLTLPDMPTGLTPAEEATYDDLYLRLCEVTPGLSEPAHLVFGHPAVIQWDPRGEGQVNLLHLGSDEDVGFEPLDAGDITFFGDATDIAAGRWERLIVSVESH